MIPPFTGHCLCKAVTYRCDAQPLWQGHCHCESCRRATASPFTSFLGVRNGTWSWTGQQPASYNSSPGTWREFGARLARTVRPQLRLQAHPGFDLDPV